MNILVNFADEKYKQVRSINSWTGIHVAGMDLVKEYTPEDIDRLYAYKESLPENKQFIFENNKETLAQVFTDVRYKKEDNEVMSENLWKVIKKQGF